MPEIYFSKKFNNLISAILFFLLVYYLLLLVPFVMSFLNKIYLLILGKESLNSSNFLLELIINMIILVFLLIFFVIGYLFIRNYNSYFILLTSEFFKFQDRNTGKEISLPLNKISEIKLVEVYRMIKYRFLFYELIVKERDSTNEYVISSLSLVEILDIATNFEIHDLLIVNKIKTNIYEYVNSFSKSVKKSVEILKLFLLIVTIIFIVISRDSMNLDYALIFIMLLIYLVYIQLKVLTLLNKFEQNKNYLFSYS